MIESGGIDSVESVFPRTEAGRIETTRELGMDAVIGAINEEKDSMEAERAEQLLQGKTEFLPGTLRELVPDERAEWTGKISVRNRLEKGEIKREHIEHLKSRVDDFYVQTTPGSIVRCIDGRTGAGFVERAKAIMASAKQFIQKKKDALFLSETENIKMSSGPEIRTISKDSPAFEALGPQIPGGTLAGGVSYRHAASSGHGDFRTASIAADAKKYGERSSLAYGAGPGGYAPGDHQAHANGDGIGCGAVDGLEDIHDKVNKNNLDTIYGLSKGILGDDFRENHFSHFISSATSLASNPDYFKSKKEAIDYLRENNPEALPELIGEHNEVLVVINRVRNTTLHRDYLNVAMKEETGTDLQVFGYDLWYGEEMALKLFPYSSSMRERYIHCRVAKAVAALMYLTDGSLEVGSRMPTSEHYALAA